MSRTCLSCKTAKPLGEFGKRSAEKDGIDRQCKRCRCDAAKRCYGRNAEHYRDRGRKKESARRADPSTRDRINSRRRERWDSASSEKQRSYLRDLRERHFFVWRARLWSARHGVRVSAIQLASLWRRQRGRCALSGLTLDRDAELDHIVPVSKGGAHDVANLRWLNPRVNYARRDMPDAAFVELCRAVADHHAGTPAMDFLIRRCVESLHPERVA